MTEPEPWEFTVPVLEAAAAKRSARADALGRSRTGPMPPEASNRAPCVKGALYHTQGGLQVDGDARIVHADGSLLPNLFAGGGAARGVSGPSYWGYLPAMGVCEAVTLGRVAGRAAAALVGARARQRCRPSDTPQPKAPLLRIRAY